MRKIIDELFKFPVSLTFRPFKNYELIKLKQKGNVYVAMAFIALMGLVYSLAYIATGFLVNFNNAAQYNGLGQFLGLVTPVILLIISNWSVTTLMNGKGKFKEIIMVAGYALFPMIVMYVIAIVFSNFMIIDESYIYYLILAIGFLFTAFSLLVGLIIVHEYSLKEALFTILLTIVAFILIVFIIFLMFSLFLQIADFIETLSREITQRLGGL